MSPTNETTAPTMLSDLPEELLSQILTHLKQTAPSSNSFTPILLLNHKFTRLATPLLYAHIALTNANLEHFVDCFPRHRGHLVRSLTLHLDAPPRQLDNRNAFPRGESLPWDPSSRHIWNLLSDLATEIGFMSKLTSFSLVRSDANERPHFWIPRESLAALLAALPPTCTNLELDTRRNDQDQPGSTHLCDSIRHLLPQLQHLRLRLENICPMLFSTEFSYDPATDAVTHLNPTHAPRLKTCVINNTAPLASTTALTDNSTCCTSFAASSTSYAHARDAASRSVMTQSLRRVLLSNCDSTTATSQTALPSIEKLYYITFQSTTHPAHNNPPSPSTSHKTYHRHNILTNSTWALPYFPTRPVRRGSGEKWYVRVPSSGEEFVISAKDVEGAVEEDSWLQGIGGVRLPREVSMACGSFEVAPARKRMLTVDARGLGRKLTGGVMVRGEDCNKEGVLGALGGRRLERLMVTAEFEDVEGIGSGGGGGGIGGGAAAAFDVLGMELDWAGTPWRRQMHMLQGHGRLTSSSSLVA